MFTVRLFDHKGIVINLWQETTPQECLMRIAEYSKINGINFANAECENEKHIVQWGFNIGERSC